MYERLDKPTKCRQCGREVALVRDTTDRQTKVSRHFKNLGFCVGSLVRLEKP
jgi:hypothetical protein